MLGDPLRTTGVTLGNLVPNARAWLQTLDFNAEPRGMP